MPLRIVALSGSPSASSKTAAIVDHILGLIGSDEATSSHIRLAELDPVALLRGDTGNPQIADMVSGIAEADGVVIATPIYKASFSGLLKVTLDLLPQYGLAGKVVLPVGTGGSPAHILALDYGLRPVLQSMGARHIVQATFVGSQQITLDGDRLQLDRDSRQLLDEAVLHFRHSLASRNIPALLGHPRPPRAA